MEEGDRGQAFTGDRRWQANVELEAEGSGDLVLRELAQRAPLRIDATEDLGLVRVLTTELRTLVAGAATVELRLGSHARLSRRRLQAVLRWV